MTSPVQNKQQISVSLNIDTRGDINPKLDALAENLRYFHSLHGKMLALELDSGWGAKLAIVRCGHEALLPAPVRLSLDRGLASLGLGGGEPT